MNKLFITTLASSLLLFTGSIARAQSARARIADTPIRAEANLASAIIATLKDGGPVEVVDLQGDWYRVLVPSEQGKPRVGYVLAHLIEIVNKDGSSQSVPVSPTSGAVRPIAQSAAIPPSTAVLARTETDRREVERARREYEAVAQPLGQTDTRPVTQALTPPEPFAPQKSYSSKFFVGVGAEGNAIAAGPSGTTTPESGRGAGLLLGYGFSPRWALYGVISAASINGERSGTYSLAHVDIGTRVHFLAGTSRVVPFIQFGVSGRAESETIGTRTFTASGPGVAFGGGLNVHFIPAFALSAGVTWSVGDFSNYQVNNQNVSLDAVSATSARVHLGVIWFPGAAR